MKIINDSVHGHIELPCICMAIVDTIQFQRLRDLKQLGSAYYVYPGASHNRFEHSIGVCYLAGEYGMHLQRQQPELGITEKDILCLQVAGLCHDLGHGPFSHLWERFMLRVKPDTNWKHERFSIEMFTHIVDQNNLRERPYWILTNDDMEFIGELIWRNETKPMLRPEKSYLYEIVSNKETGIDVDKWDYLLRDGLHLNIKTSFDYTRIMKFSRVNNGHITYRNKEVNNLIEMYAMREKLHRHAYQHRVCKVIEEMILDAFIAANECYKFSEASNDMSMYEKLSDYTFHQILHGNGCIEAKEILERIQRRQFYPFIGKFRMESEEMEDAEKVKRDIEVNFQANDLVVTSGHFDYGNNNENPIFRARFFSKYRENIATYLTECDFPSTLPKKYEEHVVFVYCKNKSNANDAKNALQEWAKAKGISVQYSKGSP